MKSHRGPITSVALAAAFACLLAPTAAAANTLLSGYGGPGQGNQAILGAALVNPPGGGSGSAGNGSAGGAAAAGTSLGTTSSGSSAGSGAAQTPPSARHRAATGAHAVGAAAANASAGGPRANSSVSALAAREPSLGSSLLGLSGADLIYILLVFGALGLTAGLTWRVAGRPRQGRAG
jgi:hypothetical protein